MPVTLSIKIGGLCLFVQRPDADPTKAGLYVLMPQYAKHAHAPKLLICDSQFSTSGKEVDLDLPNVSSTRVLDLRPFGAAGPASTLPDELLDVSRLGGAPVDARWLDQAVADPLQFRVVLPVGTPLSTAGFTKATLAACEKGEPAIFSLVGQVSVTLALDDSQFAQFNKLVPQVKPAADPTTGVSGVELQLVNIPPGDLTGRGKCEATGPDHPVGSEVDHIQGYYQLLQGGKASGPKLKVCRESKPGTRGSEQANWVDPNQCTVGKASY